MDNKNEFRPVEPKTKKFNVTQHATRFPKRAMVTLSEVKEGTSKMITLSPMAIEAMGLTEENNRFAITRGYTDETETEVAVFIYRTDEENYTFVSDKGNKTKMDSARIKWTTRRAMSAKFHGIITEFHSDPTGNSEKYFSLGARYGDCYWRLEEWQPTEVDQVVAPRADERDATDRRGSTDETVNVGESVDVTID